VIRQTAAVLRHGRGAARKSDVRGWCTCGILAWQFQPREPVSARQ
jgi:hypothetical protein